MNERKTKARTDAGKVIRQAVAAVAGGAENLTQTRLEAVGSALIELGWSGEHFDTLVGEYKKRTVYAEAVKKHPEKLAKLADDIKRADALKAEVEKLQAEERQLRAWYIPGHGAVASEQQALETVERNHAWLFNDAIAPPDRPPAKS